MRAIVITRLVLPSGIVPSIRQRFSLSFSSGPWGSTVHVSKHLAMGRGLCLTHRRRGIPCSGYIRPMRSRSMAAWWRPGVATNAGGDRG